MKKTLVAITMLLLTLMLLSTAPIAAVGSKPKEQANVELIGPDITSGVNTLDIRRAGRLVIVYGHADLVGIEWGDFQNGHELGIRIDKSGETEIIYRFDTKDFEGKEWSKYRLTGSGKWSDGSIPYGTIIVTEETFTIDEMFYERKGKKGAIGVTYVPVWSGSLSFTTTIDEI